MTKVDIENLVFSRLVSIFVMPSPYECECVSVSNLVELSKFGTNELYGLSENDIRNACRRLKAKGLIEHAWQHRNPDQPSGEYGEVWDDSPFIPHHGYGISKAGKETEVYKRTAQAVLDEWNNYWNQVLKQEV